MTKTVLFSVPKVITVTHYPEAKALVATRAALSSPKLREVVERGLNECGRLGAPTWIIDLTGRESLRKPTSSGSRRMESRSRGATASARS